LGSRWTVAQVLALAPDTSSVRAARGLANPRTWSDLGSTDSLVWGKCQGSARAPYQVTVDIAEADPAFRCTCPSRKLPCKHSLALLLMWAANNGAVADLEAAEPFAADWAAQRAGHRTRASTEKTPDPEAQAKRLVERESLMSAGIDDFERWLHDVVRQGLASVRRQPPSFWDTAGARLVDAQLPGLGDRVRAMGSAVHARNDWAPHLLGELGRWYLAVRAWRRRDELDDAAMGDLRTLLGWARRRDEVGDRLTDRWWVVGLSQEEDERLLSQRTWLYGEQTGETVVLLDFAAAGQALKVAHVLGSVVDAEVARYPGGAPRRALLTGDEPKVTAGHGLPHATDINIALDQVAGWLAGNPWLRRVPMALAGVTVVPGDPPLLVDRTGAALTLAPDTDLWQLLALSGGHPVPVFGEWIDERLHPLSVAIDDRLVSL
jgi:SWIM zinc finger